jgi:UDP-glucose:(heptosyl)LPS alpha-1,3-glucosyltransferase
MRIGLVRRGYSNTGGAENYLKRFAGALVKAGHECVLFASPQWPAQDWVHGTIKSVEGATPMEFADSLRRLQSAQSSTGGGDCDYLFSLERVWNCDCFRAGDGVHRAWLERRARYEPQWKSLFRNFNRKHRQLLEIEARLFSPEGPRAIIANSQLVKAEILQYSSYPPEQIHVIYNGLPPLLRGDHGDPTALRQEVRAELQLSDTDYVVLFAGSGWERKGLKFAIKGFKRANLPGSILLVAGRGNPKRFAAHVQGVGRVRFLGPVNGLKRVLVAADAFILPTLYDPFSNACLEALAVGLPVITTAANGMSEIIRPGTDGDVLVEPSDQTAVAKAIINWSDKEKREATRACRLALAGKYTMESNLEQSLAIIRP